jgi:methyl-accepting chemotaxis protein
MESRILALNANIQARRLGEAGRSFQVIGQEMKQFSESVRDANKGVQELAEGLLDTLPRIRTLAQGIQDISQRFSLEVTARVSEVATANAQLKQQIAGSIASGDARLQQILKLSQEALSHLQFQDPVAQALLACDRDVGECIHRAELALSGAQEGEVLQPNTAENVDEPTMESGDVLLL